MEALALMEADALEEKPQDHGRATYAPRLTSEDARVDFGRRAVEVARWIRGTDEVPGAWTTYEGGRLNVYKPVVVSEEPGEPAEPGTVLEVDTSGDGSLVVACGAGGAVRIREVKPEGKRRMSAGAWLRGAGPVAGARLG